MQVPLSSQYSTASQLSAHLEPLHVSGEGAAELKESHPQSKDIELLDLISWYPHSSHLLRAHVEVGTSNTATGLPLWSSTSRIQGCWGQEQLIVDSLNSHAPEPTDSYLEDQLQHLQ